MTTRISVLLKIRDALIREGVDQAVCLTRSAFEEGKIDACDVPEVFLALQSGASRFFDDLCALPVGSHRYPVAA